MFCFASIQLRPISDYDMLTVGRSCPGPSSQEDPTLAAWSKKKNPVLGQPIFSNVFAGLDLG